MSVRRRKIADRVSRNPELVDYLRGQARRGRSRLGRYLTWRRLAAIKAAAR